MKIKYLSVTALLVAVLLSSCNSDDDSTSITGTDFSTTIDENPESDTSLGFINATASTNDPLTYTLTSQTPSNALTINASTGELTVNDETTFDYEANTEITAEVNITANGANDLVNVTINLNDVVANKVLILAAENITYIEALKTVLEDIEDFETIDILSSHNTTAAITTDELDEYDAVLVWTDYTPSYASTLGDNLAAYIDNGGGVVEATFGASIPITGNYTSYKAYDTTASISHVKQTLSLGTLTDSNHDILDGVNSLSGTVYYNTNISPVTGATEIAQWSNGEPLVLVRENVGDSNSTVVFLNFFPRLDFWDNTTDGDILISNALKFAGNK